MTLKLSKWTNFLLLAVVTAVVLVLSPTSGRAQDNFASISSAHFDIRYQRGVAEADVRKVATFLQEEYRFLSEKLGMEMPKKLEVRMYDSKGKFKYEAASRQDWRDVIFVKGVMHVAPVQNIVSKKPFQRALSYEFSLAFLDPLGDKGCPRWLREALAVYHSGEGEVLTPPMGRRMVSFGDLNQDIQEYPNPPQRDDVHFVLVETMKFFIGKYGERKTYAMFREFNTTPMFERICRKLLGEEYSVVEKAWAAYVAEHMAPMKY
jgi:hypothetical protein